MGIKKGFLIFVVFVMMFSFAACSGMDSQQEPSMPSPEIVVILPTPSSTAEPTPSPTIQPSPSPTAEPTPSPGPASDPGAPNIIGFYTRDAHRKLLNEFAGNWKRGKDIYIFDVYATNKEELEYNSHKALFEAYWDEFPMADDYKIGYCLKFTLDTGVTHKLMIRFPKDCPKDRNAFFYPYIEVYVYDNIHLRSGVKFYHLEEKTTYPYTLMTSIKLTPGVRIDEVTAIELTTFIYKDNNDFDVVSGDYIGPVSYTIQVKRKQ